MISIKNMGRQYYSYRPVAENYKKIRISSLKRDGYLAQWYSGIISWGCGPGEYKESIKIECSINPMYPNIKFIYNQISYLVSLTTTPCHFGGKRYWFVCPLTINGRDCGKRVGVLYKGNDYFGCRHCFNLTYQSRRDNPTVKAVLFLIDYEKNIEKLTTKLKRYFYKGKATRKLMTLNKIEHKVLKAYKVVKTFNS